MNLLRTEIEKRWLIEACSIPEKAFEEVSKLCRIENKYLNKNSGIYKYVFECHHARKY
ncbi:28003_t:CDS:2 [Racocetra persica]|uniref:28003_t:CDS:1 n=1 Tax=Racocetra persica TaxID=160502 RepID=A0ACA9K8H5_9GLOM|nr:28003_t:CDS:2 [Racocetra persica]